MQEYNTPSQEPIYVNVEFSFQGWDNAGFNRLPTYQHNATLQTINENWHFSFKHGQKFIGLLFIPDVNLKHLIECNKNGFSAIFRLNICQRDQE